MSLSIQRRAAIWGDRVAVVDHAAGEVLSYEDLARRVDRTAGRLAALGVTEGDAVSLVTRNRPASLAFVFAARRLGATFAPLSHHLPPSAVAAPHDAVAPSVVVHESAQRDLVGGLDPDETVSLAEFRDVEPEGYRTAGEDRDAPLLAFHARGPKDDHAERPGDGDDHVERTGDDEEREANGGDPDGPTVAEYSDSTVEWNCVTVAAAWGLGRADCAPVVLALSHPTGLLCPALPLLYVGGTVVLQRAFDPDDTLAIVSNSLSSLPGRPVTLAVGRTPELRELSEAEDFDRLGDAALSWVACADRPPDDVRAAFAVEGVPVARVFGTVRTGPNDLLVPPDRAAEADLDCVGRPFPDCEARVVGEVAVGTDAGGEEVAAGEPGRLVVRGRVVPGGGEDVSESDGWVSTGVRARRAADGDVYVVDGMDE